MSRLIRLTIALIVLLVFVPQVTRADGPMPYEKALACVQKVLPASSYSTNEYLPSGEVTGPTPGGFKKKYPVRLGFPWIANDEETQFYIAQALGYFAEEGLEVEFVSGGPGKDHIQSLGGGAVDIGVAAGGEAIQFARTSTTPIDVMAVGTLLKDAPLGYITLKPELQGRELTPQDLIGRTIGVQPGGDLYVYMILDKAGIARDKVTIIDADFTPAVILTGRADYYAGWVMNQPRILEEETQEHPSYKGKWNILMFHKWAFSEPSDTIVVRSETLKTDEGRDMVKRFLRATYRGTKFMLDKPIDAAEIAAKFSTDVQITPAQALSRFEKQKALVVGTDKLGLLAMDPDQWDKVAASLVQYGQLKLDCK